MTYKVFRISTNSFGLRGLRLRPPHCHKTGISRSYRSLINTLRTGIK
jgi:hypothetical protein